MNNEQKPLCVGIDETGRLLSVKRTTVYALVKEGRLRKIKVKGRSVIPVVEIERFIEEAMEVAA